MKKLNFTLFLLMAALLVQTKGFTQSSAIGIFATTTEYLGDLNPKRYDVYKFKSVKVGGAISLQQYLNSSFNLVEMVSYNRLQYQTGMKDTGVSANFASANVMLKYKFNNGYILGENSFIAPYVTGGGGATYVNSKAYFFDKNQGVITKGKTVPNLLFGAGGILRLSDRVGLEYSALYNIPMYDNWDNNTGGKNDWYLQHSAGIYFTMAKAKDTDKDGVSDKKDKCPNTPEGIQVDSYGCPVDTDLDGTADYLDKCPREAGTIEMKGCPDTDKDGISDFDDKCIAVPGLQKFAGCPDTDQDGVEDSKDNCPNTIVGTPVDMNGCPVDADGDKVPDNLDKCPNTPSGMTVDINGCPADGDKDGVPDILDKCPNTDKGISVDEDGCPRDSDKDGIPDHLDRCPSTPAPGTLNGCPVVKEEIKKRLKFATRGIFFEFGKATLKPESNAKLDEVVDIINQYPDYNLRLGGHTDNVGSDENNHKLSQARVDAVKFYLISKGINEERLDAMGFGELKPIATNKTAIGRSQNRRVEMDLYLK